jgi:hypothetical protein
LLVEHLCSHQSHIKGVVMIGRFVGTVAVIAAVFLPADRTLKASQVASSEVREMVKGRPVLLEQLLEA